MSVFVDTNILLRSIQPSDPSHEVAVRATSALMEAGEKLVVTPQVFAEFWYAATRPRAKNGLGLSVQEAHAKASSR
jgi:predicted nucleic acid-binding protein